MYISSLVFFYSDNFDFLSLLFAKKNLVNRLKAIKESFIQYKNIWKCFEYE